MSNIGVKEVTHFRSGLALATNDLDVVKHVERVKQSHIFDAWDQLDDRQQNHLLAQASKVDWDLIDSLKTHFIDMPFEKTHADLKPYTPPTIQDRESYAQKGKEHIRKGELAIVTLAGGQATRMGLNSPKGCYPISPVTNKSLFEWYALKIRARQSQLGVIIPWVITCSTETVDEIKTFFETHNWFSLQKSQIHFIIQDNLPLLDEAGKVVMRTQSEIFLGPNGHGGAIMALETSGVLARLLDQGIKHLFTCQIDNPLIQMADPSFLGFHLDHQSEFSSKVIQKTHPNERVGVIAYKNEKLQVVEYSELSKEQAEQKEGEHLAFCAANIAIHLFDAMWLKGVLQGRGFPYHQAMKEVSTRNGKQRVSKFEAFLFDLMPQASNAVCMEVKREEEFAPVKSLEGTDTPERAKQMVSDQVREMFSNLGIHLSKEGLYELNPLYITSKKDLQQLISYKHEND